MNPSSDAPSASGTAVPGGTVAGDVLASPLVLPIDPPPSPAGRRCENCGTPLLGEHCYACGQPIRGMVRHFGTIFGDFIDTVFNVDSRTVRSIVPLLFRPGRLTQEYFDGHRVRFVSPVRLFFFFCVAAFLALQFSIDTGDGFDMLGKAGDISSSQTVKQVQDRRDAAIAGMTAASKAIPEAPGSRQGMEEGMDQIRAEADQRIAWLTARDAAIAAGQPPPVDPQAADGEDEDETFRFNDKEWNAETNPLTVAWLPQFANDGLNRLIGRARANIEHVKDEPSRLAEAFLQTLPQTLFVLLPVFALMLKIVYLFKRRLYMEHLIVALHSHAFLCAALLVIVGLADLGALFETGSVIEQCFEWLVFLMMCWMPIYLLLMQKRVYRQGWIMTLLKYFVLGNLYLILISFGVVVNLALSLVAM